MKTNENRKKTSRMQAQRRNRKFFSYFFQMLIVSGIFLGDGKCFAKDIYIATGVSKDGLLTKEFIEVAVKVSDLFEENSLEDSFQENQQAFQGSKSKKAVFSPADNYILGDAFRTIQKKGVEFLFNENKNIQGIDFNKVQSIPERCKIAENSSVEKLTWSGSDVFPKMGTAFPSVKEVSFPKAKKLVHNFPVSSYFPNIEVLDISALEILDKKMDVRDCKNLKRVIFSPNVVIRNKDAFCGCNRLNRETCRMLRELTSKKMVVKNPMEKAGTFNSLKTFKPAPAKKLLPIKTETLIRNKTFFSKKTVAKTEPSMSPAKLNEKKKILPSKSVPRLKKEVNRPSVNKKEIVKAPSVAKSTVINKNMVVSSAKKLPLPVNAKKILSEKSPFKKAVTLSKFHPNDKKISGRITELEVQSQSKIFPKSKVENNSVHHPWNPRFHTIQNRLDLNSKDKKCFLEDVKSKKHPENVTKKMDKEFIKPKKITISRNAFQNCPLLNKESRAAISRSNHNCTFQSKAKREKRKNRLEEASYQQKKDNFIKNIPSDQEEDIKEDTKEDVKEDIKEERVEEALEKDSFRWDDDILTDNL